MEMAGAGPRRSLSEQWPGAKTGEMLAPPYLWLFWGEMMLSAAPPPRSPRTAGRQALAPLAHVPRPGRRLSSDTRRSNSLSLKGTDAISPHNSAPTPADPRPRIKRQLDSFVCARVAGLPGTLLGNGSHHEDVGTWDGDCLSPTPAASTSPPATAGGPPTTGRHCTLLHTLSPWRNGESVCPPRPGRYSSDSSQARFK